MIIAAYAGCGKTKFAEKTWNSIDMVCVPYKYLISDIDEYPDKKREEYKANYCYELNPEWPGNYVSAVITAYHRYQYVVIPTIKSVLWELRRFKLPYILCYPDRSLKEEYRNRYRMRGNVAAFEKVFVDGWDAFLNEIEADKYGKHITLGSGEYLLDRRDEIEAFTKKEETAVNFCIDDSVEDDVKRIFEETGVCIEEQLRQFMHFAAENEDIVALWKEEGMIEIPKDYKLMNVY